MILRKMLTMLLNIDEKKEKLMWELGFLAVYAVLLTVYFIDTTVVALKIPALIPNHLSYRLWIRLFAITFVVLKTVRDERFSWKELIFTAIILISFGRCAQVAGYMELVDLAVLIIGARNVSFKKILQLYVGLTGVLIVVFVGAALAGKIEDWVFYLYPQEGGIIAKHSYGFQYPNEFAAHIFFWFLGWGLLRGEKITKIECVVMVITSVLIWKYCRARTNAICIVMLTCSILLCSCLKKIRSETILKTIRIILGVTPGLLCLLMVVFACVYDATNPIMVQLDALLNSRLKLGKSGLLNYGVKLFGQHVTMIGMGWPVTNYEAYNFLDCSYHSILIRFGVAAFMAFGMCFVANIKRALRQRDYKMLVIVAVCAFQCVMEHHLHEIAYNPLVLVPLAIVLDEKPNAKQVLESYTTDDDRTKNCI